jgi:hypothetical protein
MAGKPRARSAKERGSTRAAKVPVKPPLPAGLEQMAADDRALFDYFIRTYGEKAARFAMIYNAAPRLSGRKNLVPQRTHLLEEMFQLKINNPSLKTNKLATTVSSNATKRGEEKQVNEISLVTWLRSYYPKYHEVRVLLPVNSQGDSSNSPATRVRPAPTYVENLRRITMSPGLAEVAARFAQATAALNLKPLPQMRTDFGPTAEIIARLRRRNSDDG